MKTQSSFFKRASSDYGGSLRNQRKGRQGSRPLSVKYSMHLVLRSTQARGELSFRHNRNEKRVTQIIKKFSEKHSIRILSFANVGNHLHFQIQLGSRASYKPFIRAITGALAQMLMKASRQRKIKTKFWDHRPFTRIVKSFREHLNLQSYISINRLEALGLGREQARVVLALSSA